jgi:hypothetical protein
MERYGDEAHQRDARTPGSKLASNQNTAESVRDSGLRRIRRLSNWSLAALVVGVGATTGVLARTVPAATTGATAVTNSGNVTSTIGAQQAPSVSTPVATTSASGVTTSVSRANTHAGGPSRVVAAGSGDS